MNKAMSVALLAVGAILMILQINASQSLGSDVSRLVTGSPTSPTIWLFVAGAAALVAGLVMLFQQSRST
jgi:hypothetical protein